MKPIDAAREARSAPSTGRAVTARRLAWFAAFYLLGLAGFTAATSLLRRLIAP